MELKKILVHAGGGSGGNEANPVDVIRRFTGTGTRSGA